jgi:hypothetical protein
VIVYDLTRPKLIASGPYSDCFLVDDEGHCFPDSFESFEHFQRHLQEQETGPDSRED